MENYQVCQDMGCPRNYQPLTDAESITYDNELAGAYLALQRNGIADDSHLRQEAMNSGISARRILAAKGCAAIMHMKFEHVPNPPAEIRELPGERSESVTHRSRKRLGFLEYIMGSPK